MSDPLDRLKRILEIAEAGRFARLITERAGLARRQLGLDSGFDGEKFHAAIVDLMVDTLHLADARIGDGASGVLQMWYGIDLEEIARRAKAIHAREKAAAAGFTESA